MSFKMKWVIFLTLSLLIVSIGFNRSYQDVRTLPLHLSSAFIHFYKKNISVAGAPECSFYPSCSVYARGALEKYGFLRGWAMSFDRLSRCNHEEWIYPEILVEDQIKKYDPIPFKEHLPL